MATFIDDTPETDEDTQNIQEAQEAEQQPTPEQEDDIPERYRGKSAKDLIRMHQEAEKLMGRHSQEVGELRRVVDDFIKQQTVVKEAPKEEDVDFFTDPEKAIDARLAKHPKLIEAERLNAELAKERALMALQKAHPDFSDIVQNDGFKEWVAKSKVRSELLNRADQRYDFEAADELFTSWKERQEMLKNTTAIQQADRKTQLKQASTGATRGSGEPQSKKIYRRSDIVDLMRKDPDRYMALQPEIMAAYAEGRVK
jgi:hypothetical protein